MMIDGFINHTLSNEAGCGVEHKRTLCAIYRLFHYWKYTCNMLWRMWSYKERTYCPTKQLKNNHYHTVFRKYIIIHALNADCSFLIPECTKSDLGRCFPSITMKYSYIGYYCSCQLSTTFPVIPHAGTGSRRRKYAKVNTFFSYQCHILVILQYFWRFLLN